MAPIPGSRGSMRDKALAAIAEARAVSVRTRAKGDQGSMPLTEFLANSLELVKTRSTEL